MIQKRPRTSPWTEDPRFMCINAKVNDLTNSGMELVDQCLEGNDDEFNTIIGGQSRTPAPDSPTSPFSMARRGTKRTSLAWARGELNIAIRNSFRKQRSFGVESRNLE